MKETMRRCGLLVLAALPIASVAFAAKSALSISQINKAGVTTTELGSSGYDSKG